MENLLIAYRILGVGEQATIAEVTKAYRTLAKKYHPDSNPDQKDHAHSMKCIPNRKTSSFTGEPDC
jgi:molecular chaperone DnaJ